MSGLDAEKIMSELQKPFPAEEVEWRVDRGQKTQNGNYVFVLAYVTNRAIQNRLDDLFGPFGWRNEYREWKGNSQLCGISVKVDGEWITKWDGSDDSNMDAVKGGLSGAMKRTAVQWGIGRYLYNLEQNRVPLKERGQNYTNVKVKVSGKEEYIKGYWDTPVLPKWALPEGYILEQPQPQEYQEEHPDTTPMTQEEIKNIDEDLEAIAAASAQINKPRAPKNESSGIFVTEGQARMLYAKYKQSEYKELPKTDVLELISAQLAKKVDDFKFVEKADVNKVIKWFEEHAA